MKKRARNKELALVGDYVSLEDYFTSRGVKAAEDRKAGKKPSPAGKILQLLLLLALCLAAALLVRLFVLQHNTVVGSSMIPTLEDRDKVIVEKVTRYFASGLKRGDIVTAGTRDPASDKAGKGIIKRLVGLPGEQVTIGDGKVYIDGAYYEEDYLEEGTQTLPGLPEYGDLLLGPDEYYLLGDNREQSLDSRRLGPFKRNELGGRLIFRFYPFDRIGKPR